MAYGFIYIAVNETMPGLVKIGHTTISPSERVRQLSQATGVPAHFDLYSAYEVENALEAESNVHAFLAAHRHSRRREFFEVTPRKAHETVLEVCGVVNFMPTVVFASDQKFWGLDEN